MSPGVGGQKGTNLVILICEQQIFTFKDPVTVNIKRLSDQLPSNGQIIICRADSWRQRHVRRASAVCPANDNLAARWC